MYRLFGIWTFYRNPIFNQLKGLLPYRSFPPHPLGNFRHCEKFFLTKIVIPPFWYIDSTSKTQFFQRTGDSPSEIFGTVHENW